MNDNRPTDLERRTEELRARLAAFIGQPITRLELRDGGIWWAIFADGRERTTTALLHDGL